LESIRSAVDFPTHIHGLKATLGVAEGEGLLGPERQIPQKAKTLLEKTHTPLLKSPVEIDKDIPAKDQVELIKTPVGGQVVQGKNHVLLEGGIENDVVVPGGIVSGKDLLPPAVAIVPGIFLHVS
jgi:hypothetical protein